MVVILLSIIVIILVLANLGAIIELAALLIKVAFFYGLPLLVAIVCGNDPVAYTIFCSVAIIGAGWLVKDILKDSKEYNTPIPTNIFWLIAYIGFYIIVATLVFAGRL